MSFLRHREIYRSDGLGFRESGARSGGLHAPTHRCDGFPAGYSLAGCAPAEPASASPAEQKFTMKAIPRPSFFQRMGKPCLAACLTSGVHRASRPSAKATVTVRIRRSLLIETSLFAFSYFDKVVASAPIRSANFLADKPICFLRNLISAPVWDRTYPDVVTDQRSGQRIVGLVQVLKLDR